MVFLGITFFIALVCLIARPLTIQSVLADIELIPITLTHLHSPPPIPHFPFLVRVYSTLYLVPTNKWNK